MNIQELLNSKPLQEAADYISEQLVNKKANLEEQRELLIARRSKYEEDYIKANDGDSSENAPLDEAKKNLRLVTGEIVDNLQMLARLESLEDAKYLRRTYDFSEIKGHFATQTGNLVPFIKQKFQTLDPNDFVYKIKNNFDEASLTNMLDEMIKEANDPEPESNEYKLIKSLLDYLLVLRKPDYNHCGIVVMYSTVRIKSSVHGVHTYKIYPGGVSFLDMGILAANSRVAEAIMGGKVGTKVDITNNSNRQTITYEIIDLY